jgi:hypothetical protein
MARHTRGRLLGILLEARYEAHKGHDSRVGHDARHDVIDGGRSRGEGQADVMT